MIDPSFWLDEDMGELSRDARLFYIGLWSYADDQGRLEDKRKQLKAQIFPYDQIEVEQLLQELINLNKVVNYTVEDKNYLWIRNFLKWQKIEKPTPSKFPAYPEEFVEESGRSRGEVGPKRSKEKLKEVKRNKETPTSSKLDLTIFTYLSDKDFYDLWTAFLDSRKKLKAPATEQAQKMLLTKLHKWGVEEAKDALRNSIERGWRGVFEPKPEQKQDYDPLRIQL